MAWIKTTSEQDATGELKEVYGAIRKSFPMLPNNMAASRRSR